MQEFQIRVHRYTPKNFFRRERFDTLRASFPLMWHLFSRRKSSSASPIFFSLILFTDSSELKPKKITSPFRNCILVESIVMFRIDKHLNRGSSFNFRIFTKLLSYYPSPMGSEGERLRNIKSPSNVLTYLEEVQNI